MIVIFLFVCLFISTSNVFAESEIQHDQSRFRLPTNVEPISYKIDLIVDLESNWLKYDGSTIIRIEVKEPTNSIILHSHNLTINEIILLEVGGNPISHQNFSIDTVAQIVRINFEKPLHIGDYDLCFRYQDVGKRHNSTDFVYLPHYKFKYGEELPLTNLSTMNARNLFPCWDEPKFKANFTLKVIHDDKYNVLSNTYVIERSIDEQTGQAVTLFAETPKMSTYLVGIVVSYSASIHSDNGLIRLHSRFEMIDKISSILELAEKTIQFLDDYTEIPFESFGLGTLDIVLIPPTFDKTFDQAFWGLITIRETDILDINQINDSQSMDLVKLYVIHDCFLQWFSGLVTISWWSDNWIQESFLNNFHMFIADQINPTWRVKDELMVSQSLAYYQNEEKMDKCRAIHSKNDFNEDYHCQYLKSMHYIQTFTYIIDDERFRLLWRRFLKTHAYQTITANDLIDELAEASKIEKKMMHEIFDNWLSVRGLPILHVTRDYKNGIIMVNQSRYLDPTIESDTVKQQYWIPIDFVTENNLDFNDFRNVIWMRPNDSELKFKDFSADEWVIFNEQNFGYYIVNYDEKHWALIIKTLKSKNFTNIPVQTRVRLINNAFNLYEVKRINVTIFLSLIGYLENETDVLPWIAAYQKYLIIYSDINSSKYGPLLKNYFVKLSNHLVKVLNDDGWPYDSQVGNSYLFNKHRDEWQGLICLIDKTKCLKSRISLREISQWVNNPEQSLIPNEILMSTFCDGLGVVTYELWDKVWKKMMKNNAIDVFFFSCCTLDETMVKELLYRLIEWDKTKNSTTALSAIYYLNDNSNLEWSFIIALDFLEKNWSFFMTMYPQKLIEKLFMSLTNVIFLEAQLDMFKNIINTHRSDLHELNINPEKLFNNSFSQLEQYQHIIPDFEEFFLSLGNYIKKN